MAHRCFGALDLRRGTVAIAVFYVCYLLLLTLTLAVLAAVLADETPLAGRLAMATGGLLLLVAVAGALLFGAVRRRRPLLLLWLLTYGAVLITLTVGMMGLAIAAETGQRTFLTEFCASRPTGRCSYRLFHYVLLLFALEWYFWAVVLLRYRQMGREVQSDLSGAGQLGPLVRGTHNGQLKQVPVAFYGDAGLLTEGVTADAGCGPGYGSAAMHAGPQVRPLTAVGVC